MILMVHILVGALIVLKIKILWLALLLAFLSHYFLDSLPHWDYSIENIKKRNWKQTSKEFLIVFFDILTATILVLFLSKNILLSFIGAFFSTLPDGLHLLYRIWPNKFLKIHQRFHQKINFPRNKISPFWGILAQIIIISIAIWQF